MYGLACICGNVRIYMAMEQRELEGYRRVVATRFEVVRFDNTRIVLLLCVTGTVLNFAGFFIAGLIRP